MATPITKPIIFPARGLEPDVRMRVLDQAEFHVHSTILKLKSQYFFELLDPENNSNDDPEGFSDGFKYEWVSQVDAGGNWFLFNANAQRVGHQRMGFKGNLKLNVETFTYFLQALYGIPSPKMSISRIEKMCEFADSYLALPALSQSLSNTLILSKIPLANSSNAQRLLKVAVKCHHRDLFQDCIIFIAGEHNGDNEPEIKEFLHLDPKVRKIAQSVRQKIDLMALSAHKFLVTISEEYIPFREVSASLAAYGNSLPAYYRLLHSWGHNNKDDSSTGGKEVCSTLSPILAKYTTFDFCKEDAYDDEDRFFFFCGQVSDEDLPWDKDQIDWYIMPVWLGGVWWRGVYGDTIQNYPLC